jgi:serine phosphatase RsbU (regulator of sigma subunit)
VLFAQKPPGYKALYDSARKYEANDWDLAYLYAKMAFEADDSASFAYKDVISLNIILDTYYQKKNMLDSSFSVCKRSLQLAKDHNDKSLTAYGHNNMAVIYSLAGNYQASIDMYKKALRMLVELNDVKQIANTNFNLSIPFSGLKMNDSALYYTNMAFGNYKKINDYSGLASCYNSYASEEDQKGNYAEAIRLYELEVLNFKLAEERASLIVPYQNMADTYLKWKKFRECKEYLEMSMELAISLGSNTDMYEIYYIYSDYYEALGDYKKANEYLKKHYEGKATIMTDDLKMELADQKSEFDRENSENMLLINQLESEKNLKSKQAVLWVLVLSVIFFGVVIILYINRYRIKQKSFVKLNEYKNQLVLQKERIEDTQKEIIDSINYAKRIQSAIMSLEEDIHAFFPESFLIYKPKNIVAGDFYFFETTGNHVFYAAADCTGHGVPGALVSVVCANALTRCVKEFGLSDPGKILDKTRDLVLETFRKSGKEVKDGMDISLCCFEADNLKSGTGPVNIQWAGAYNSLWYIAEEKLVEVKADKQPIGYIEKPKPFTTHTLSFERGTPLYLFTDGYVDQFGGEKARQTGSAFGQGKKLKYRQLAQKLIAINHKSMPEQKNDLDAYFTDWKGDLEQVDDILVLGMRL